MRRKLVEIWEEIEKWDVQHKSNSLGSHLSGAASAEHAESLNQRVGGKLPSDFIESLRRHNGTASWTTKFYGGTFFDIDEILETIDELREISRELIDADQRNGVDAGMSLHAIGPVKPHFWSENWIPIHTTDWSKTCLDFDPAAGGDFGQIISVGWEGGTVKVIAKDYLGFLQECADNLPS